MAKLKSEGKCIYCEKLYSKGGMNRHLANHLQTLEKEMPTTGEAFLVKVSAAEMFLFLLVDGNQPLQALDNFLRRIWLECCGHISSFEIKGKGYDTDLDDFGDTDLGEKKTDKMKTIFRERMTLEYEYDFGSTTNLKVEVLKKHHLKVPKGIQLLTRNEPLEILCHICEKEPAEKICSIHLWDGEGLLCKACAKKHEKVCDDFADYAEMPVVNSPRMGVCGYDGGTIDQERDGIFKK